MVRNQDEEMGMTVEQAMQMVRMMAAELGLVEYRVPLPSGKWGYLYLPKTFKVADAERMSGWIRAMVMEEFEEVSNREQRLAEALARSMGISEEGARAVIRQAKQVQVIHAHPTAKTGGLMGCCGKKPSELEDGCGHPLTTTDPKVVTCNVVKEKVKPED